MTGACVQCHVDTVIDYGRRAWGGGLGGLPGLGLEDWIDGRVIPDSKYGIRCSLGVGGGGQA